MFLDLRLEKQHLVGCFQISSFKLFSQVRILWNILRLCSICIPKAYKQMVNLSHALLQANFWTSIWQISCHASKKKGPFFSAHIFMYLIKDLKRVSDLHLHYGIPVRKSSWCLIEYLGFWHRSNHIGHWSFSLLNPVNRSKQIHGFVVYLVQSMWPWALPGVGVLVVKMWIKVWSPSTLSWEIHQATILTFSTNYQLKFAFKLPLLARIARLLCKASILLLLFIVKLYTERMRVVRETVKLTGLTQEDWDLWVQWTQRWTCGLRWWKLTGCQRESDWNCFKWSVVCYPEVIQYKLCLVCLIWTICLIQCLIFTFSACLFPV